MAIQGPIPMDFGTAFPHGVFAAGVFEPVRDFDRSQGDRFVQQNDKATGAPLWAVEVIDADPQARARTVKIKVISPHQPVLPSAAGGAPFVPVEFTGLTVMNHRVVYTPQGQYAGHWPAPGGKRDSEPSRSVRQGIHWQPG